MKNYMIAFVLSVIAPLSIAYGANNGAKARSTTTYTRTASTTQKGNSGNTNFYYNQSGRKRYSTTSEDSYTTTTKKQTEYSGRTQRKTVTQERKYFLAHPFFQPLQGRFGSVTDIAFSKNRIDFDMLSVNKMYDLDPNSSSYWPNTHTPLQENVALNVSAKAETNQFLVKEDFSFGITDKIAIIAMGQYDSTKFKLKDWSDGTPEDKTSDSGLNVFGFGAQFRFLDVSKAIGMTTILYENQRDTADSLMADVKLGYKFDRTTLYLVGRGGYSWLKNKNSSYGFYMEDTTGDWFMLTYKRNVDDLFYAEGGLGVFSVLNKYLTLNAEAYYGSYDWHNQLTAKAAFGVQPYDSFALNLYVSGVLYDSGEGKTKQYLLYDVNPVDASGTPLDTKLTYTEGDYKFKSYSEYKMGVQLILHF